MTIIGRVSDGEAGGTTHDELRRRFRWRIPDRYNIAADTVDRHAATEPDRVALIHEDETGASGG